MLLIYSYLSIIASIYLTIYNALSDYVSNYILLFPVLILIFVIVLQTLTGIIAGIKKFKQNEKVQIFYYKIVKLGSILAFGPLYKNILQITMIFGSNFKKKKSLIGLIVLFLFSGMFVAIFKIGDTNIFYLVNQNIYFDSTKIYAGYYYSENKENDFLLTPEIPSDIIKQDFIKIFIPIFSHESRMRTDVCGSFEKNESLSREENRKNKKKFNLDCYNLYNLVFLNGQKLMIDYMKYEHPRTQQFGILGYISSKNLKEGKNTVVIKKASDTETLYEWFIPFYYTTNRSIYSDLQN